MTPQDKVKWLKVKHLREGMQIAVLGSDGKSAAWEKIVAIKHLPAEQVFDIQVEGTHNFVGNGIVAHNTFINSSATGTVALNIDSTGAVTSGDAAGLDINVSSASTTVPAAIITNAGSSHALRVNDDGTTTDTTPFVIDSAGNVGIGTTGPGHPLDVNGLARATAFIGSGTVADAGLLRGANNTTLIAARNAGNTANITLGTNSSNSMVLSMAHTGIGVPYFRVGMAADTTNWIGFNSQQSSTSNFLPTLIGFSGRTTEAGLTMAGLIDSTVDSGDIPVFQMDAYKNNNTALSTRPVLRIRNWDQVVLQIQASGNVGIGTTAPDSKLHLVAGDLYVAPDSGYTFNNPSANEDLYVVGNLEVDGTIYGAVSGGIDGTGTANYLPKFSDANTLTNSLLYDDGTNVGIGTTAPSSFKLQLAGSLGPNSDDTYDLGSNTLRWRDLYLGPGTIHLGTSTSDEYAVSFDTTANRLEFNLNGSGNAEVVLDSSGNLGIGTTSPVQKLHVEGQCVTGDTILRRRRKKAKVKSVKSKVTGGWDPDDFEDVRIDQIKAGDEILTLDEKTGKFVVSKVKGLMDMGIQQVYKVITRSGLRIETTDNHPYLVRSFHNKPERTSLGMPFEVDQSNRVEQLHKDSYIAIANPSQQLVIHIPRTIKRQLYKEYAQKRSKKLFGPTVFAQAVAVLLERLELVPGEIYIDKEYDRYEDLIERVVRTSHPKTNLEFVSIGKKSAAHRAAYLAGYSRRANKKAAVEPVIKVGTAAALHPEFHRDQQPAHGLHLEKYNTQWQKVKYLKPGMIIATTRGWDPISAIYATSRKQTFDIQVANTHNFVGNGIVAHNTYISNADPSLILNTTNTTDTDFWLGVTEDTDGVDDDLFTIGDGTTPGTNTFLTINTSGNVGIGTTAPAGKLEIEVGASDAATGFLLDTDDVDQISMQITAAQTTADVMDVVADALTTAYALDISVDALTTGRGINLTSTSTALSSGSLVYVDWSPGSSTTATGDLFYINIGSNGNAGSLLKVAESGSAVFTVTETQITSALPHQFTAAGDVSIAYDLVMTNQTASFIKSYGPFTIEAGESFENNNLTLKTYGTGDTVFDMGGDVILQNADPALVFDVTTATDTDFWIGVIDDAGGDDDDFLRIGDGAVPGTNTFVTINTSGNVGIGTTSPATALDVVGDIRTSEKLSVVNAIYDAVGSELDIGDGTDNIDFHSGAAYITTAGNVGIGTSSPSAKLDVNGTIQVNVAADTVDRETLCVAVGGGSVTRDAAGNNCDTSSLRFKHDIQTLDINGIELVNTFRPTSFIRNSDLTQRVQWGFIAEDMAQSDPHLALFDESGLPYSISKYGIMAALTKAVQELDVRTRATLTTEQDNIIIDSSTLSSVINPAAPTSQANNLHGQNATVLTELDLLTTRLTELEQQIGTGAFPQSTTKRLQVSEQLEAQQLAAYTGEQKLVKATATNTNFLAGVVESVAADQTAAVITSGVARIKVTNEHGQIKKGDFITTSIAKPGDGIKALEPGMVVGIALEEAEFIATSEAELLLPEQEASAFADITAEATATAEITIPSQTSEATNSATSPLPASSADGAAGESSSSRLFPPPRRAVGGQAEQLAEDDIEVLVNIMWYSGEQESIFSQLALGQAQLGFAETPTFASTLAETEPSLDLDQTELKLNNLTAYQDLNVLGTTTLNDVGITGYLNIGLLTFSDNTINSLGGVLRLQDLPGSGNIKAFGEKIVMTTQGDIKTLGSITATKYNVDTSDIAEASAGTALMPTGITHITIKTGALTSNSLIFVTPDRAVPIGSKKISENEFEITIQSPQTTDLTVNWWIIN